MRSTLTKHGFAALSLAAILTMTACAEPRQVRVAASVPGPAPVNAVVVERAPPAEIVETVPPAPGPGERWVWQRGHWRWDGDDYHWRPGHWVERPAYATEWVEPRWEPRGSGYFFIEGHWR